MIPSLAKKLSKFFGGASPGDYEEYWTTARGSYSERFIEDVVRQFEFNTVLDAGCGDGTVVRRLLGYGKDACGVDISATALKQRCGDLFEMRRVTQSPLTKLPFADDTFDLVFSSEVMEHLAPSDVPTAIKEMVRVCRKTLFLTISLRPSSENNKFHLTLRPRAWWNARFLDAGVFVRDDLISLFQQRLPNASNSEVLKRGPTKAILHEIGWFINSPPYDLQGELEPWFFVFSKGKH
ncbi:MAG TPA: class I SAM-dependent methyltransferase [Tepidisphaeraceae bacterium]|nr:class I SAM-dependent methyltransferase [Tepidisphaeraceae bacterium]